MVKDILLDQISNAGRDCTWKDDRLFVQVKSKSKWSYEAVKWEVRALDVVISDLPGVSGMFRDGPDRVQARKNCDRVPILGKESLALAPLTSELVAATPPTPLPNMRARNHAWFPTHRPTDPNLFVRCNHFPQDT